MFKSGLLLIIGLLSILAGVFALFNPFPATLAVNMIAGWSFLILGIVQAIEAFRIQGWGARIWAVLLGLIGGFVGLNLLANPLKGVIVLTLLLATVFLVSGVVKIITGFRIGRGDLRLLLLISGAASLVLALIIFSNFPASAAKALGILLGIELISNGVASVALALSRNGTSVRAA